ncbi:MAG TPA: hypothetical protein VJH94_03125 [Candidatus Paceibacterota bacterium]
MVFSFSRSHKREFGAVIFVELSNVRLMVFEYLAVSRVRIFFSEKKPLPRYTAPGYSFDKRVATSIASAAYQLLHEFERVMLKKNYAVTPSEIYVLYAPSIAQTSTERIYLENKKTKAAVSQETLQTLLKEGEQRAILRMRENVKKETVPFPKQAVIERALTELTIDGYPVHDVFSKEFRDFSALISIVTIPEMLLLVVTDACHSIFRKATLFHKVSVSETITALRDLEKMPDRFFCALLFQDFSVFMYVGTHDMSKQLLLSNGAKHIESGLAKSLSSSRTVMMSYAALAREDKLHGTSQSRLKKALQEAAQNWYFDAVKAKQNMSDLLVLPKTLYVVPSGEIDEMVLATLTESGNTTNVDFQIQVLSKKQIQNIEVTEHVSAGAEDLLLIAWILVHRGT